MLHIPPRRAAEEVGISRREQQLGCPDTNHCVATQAHCPNHVGSWRASINVWAYRGATLQHLQHR